MAAVLPRYTVLSAAQEKVNFMVRGMGMFLGEPCDDGRGPVGVDVGRELACKVRICRSAQQSVLEVSLASRWVDGFAQECSGLHAYRGHEDSFGVCLLPYRPTHSGRKGIHQAEKAKKRVLDAAALFPLLSDLNHSFQVNRQVIYRHGSSVPHVPHDTQTKTPAP